MDGSLKLDSHAMMAISLAVGDASSAAGEMLPTTLDESCITVDFRDAVEDLFSVWKDESGKTSSYLAEFARDLDRLSLEMAKAEEALAREAGKP